METNQFLEIEEIPTVRENVLLTQLDQLNNRKHSSW